MRAMGGKAFHPQCFSCGKCGAELLGKRRERGEREGGREIVTSMLSYHLLLIFHPGYSPTPFFSLLSPLFSSSLSAKGSYGLYEGNPYCPIHTPLTKEELERQAQKAREQVKARYQQLINDIDSVHLEL